MLVGLEEAEGGFDVTGGVVAGGREAGGELFSGGFVDDFAAVAAVAAAALFLVSFKAIC